MALPSSRRAPPARAEHLPKVTSSYLYTGAYDFDIGMAGVGGEGCTSDCFMTRVKIIELKAALRFDASSI